MRFEEYDRYDATGLAKLVRDRTVTPTELLETALARMEAVNPAINAVVHRYAAYGRGLIARGLPEGPFTGVPFLVKGTGAALAGLAQTNGSALLQGNVAARDATLAERHLAAGLVPIGRTNVPEFAMSFTTEPEAFGATHNPWDLARMPGGSSGGSAAAVAAGIVPMAHAADGAGSMRVPAAHCGLFGFKPSRIRNPMGPEAAEVMAGMGTPHALSRSVRDSALLLDATSGPAVGDPYAAPPPVRPFIEEVGRPPGRLRIGLVTAAPLGAPIDAACLDATMAAARLCEALGHDVEEAAFPHDAAGLQHAWRLLAGVTMARQVTDLGRQRGVDPLSVIETVNAAWAVEGHGWSGADYMAAVNLLHRIGRSMGEFFGRYDVFLSPVTAAPAPLLGQLAGAGLTLDAFYDRFWHHAPYTAAFNASGCPAMSVPLGWPAGGTPIGVHFGAGFGQDGLLLALAAQLEAAEPWFHRRPPL